MSDTINRLRNIALIAHGGAGKTSLAEAMLFDAGVIKRMGNVPDGNTTMDFEPEEIKRTSSISSGFFRFDWRSHTISLIDTPGDQNFISEAKSCLQAADAAVMVVDAVDGVKVQTEMTSEYAKNFGQPCVIFINKLDRERADFMRTFKDISGNLEPKPIILQLPIGAEDDFKGVVDLIQPKAWIYAADGKAKAGDIPADMQEQVDIEREALIENIAEADDELVERYLEGETLSEQELLQAKGGS